MPDLPIDAWYCWVGLAAASLAVAGVAVELPTRPAPDAAAAADTVDAVAAASYPTTAEHPVDASAVRLDPHRLSLRNAGGTTHATFGFGPVVPVAADSRLQRVATGDPPSSVFDSPVAFARAVEQARERTESRDATWRQAPARIRITRVHWEGTNVTLVDA
ncbi:DUF7283 family protein [Haloarchaeobius amylolyticus]|uniref:DUF7283 family protein n=1 Tax=Haloarchaeobius amylolyticus TaxID=1198296 RepID=UPI00226D531D|nr:hypothetical protein [Haloarchaeobius amylolyticus]